jgi:hypothetical protein
VFKYPTKISLERRLSEKILYPKKHDQLKWCIQFAKNTIPVIIIRLKLIIHKQKRLVCQISRFVGKKKSICRRLFFCRNKKSICMRLFFLYATFFLYEKKIRFVGLFFCMEKKSICRTFFLYDKESICMSEKVFPLFI